MRPNSHMPVVSVIIANYNGGRFLAGAIQSALRQTLSDIEIIVVDDASTDDSQRIALDLAENDDRINVLIREKNGGPATARNMGLATARGAWAAILDSDDLMHPERLAALVTEAEASDADICADDLLVFGAGIRPHGLLSRRKRKRGWITLPDFIASNAIHSRHAATGYLKPIVKLPFLWEHEINYDPSLKIGEDFELVARALAKGAKFRLVDSLGYFYRKHEHSTSHRLSANDLAQMLRADERLRGTISHSSQELVNAFQRREASIKHAVAFENLIAALKAKAWGNAFSIAFRTPRIVPLLRMPLLARLRRLWPLRELKATTAKRACLISRQRLIGSTNGSSAYLLGICNALRDSGYQLTLISPNSGTFGRFPFFRLRAEMSVFDEIFLRGAWKIGPLCIAKDPRIALDAARAIAARATKRFGFNLTGWDTPAPYVIGAPWYRDEFLYVAQHASPADLVIADYAFSTPAIPFALAENARSIVVMHDLLSTRAGRFKDAGLADSVKTLDEVAEFRLLGQADAVLAIQDVEAHQARKLLPTHPVILTPVACQPVTSAAPGSNRSILFVGSNTAPNVIGLRWFLQTVWPRVLAEVPDCELNVAGSVGSQFPDGAFKSHFLGVVADLTPLYDTAGVVISPLTVGSGLKVKVVQALGQGKAIVATSVSVEGIADDVLSGVAVSDDPSEFAEAVTALLLDDQLRQTKAADALRQFEKAYSREACFRGLLSYLGSHTTKPTCGFRRGTLLERQAGSVT